MTLFPDENRLTSNTVDVFAIDLTSSDIKSDLYKLKTRSYYLKTRQYDPKSVKKHLKSEKKSPQTTAKNTYLHLSALEITLSSDYKDKRCRINQILSDISPNRAACALSGGWSRPLSDITLYAICIVRCSDQTTNNIGWIYRAARNL